MNPSYDSATVRAQVEGDIDRLFAPWALGRPENWKPDPTTKLVIALGYWLDAELRSLDIDDEGRKIQLLHFNRWSRSVDDLFGLAAETMNDAVAGRIDRDRKPHRRWG